MTGLMKLAVQNLFRHLTRSLLTMLGIGAAVAVLFSVLSFNRGFEAGLQKELKGTGLHFMVVPSGCAHEVAALVLHGAVIPKFLEAGVIDNVNRAEGISLATPILVAQMPNSEAGRIDLIYGVETTMLSDIKPDWKISGEYPVAANELLLGYNVAKHNGIVPGGGIRYPGVEGVFVVTGIVAQTSSQDDAFIYMDIRKAQEILQHPGGATAVGVKVADPIRMQEVIEGLESQVPGIQIVTMGQVMNSVTTVAASARSLSLAVAMVALIIGIVGVMNAILMAVFERTQEIGMMRAIGASRWDIFSIILRETAVLTMAGGIAGILIAAAGSTLIEGFVRRVMPYMPTGDMLRFEPLLAVGCVLFAMIIGVLAGFYPAWKASRINPIEAIKG
jgi:putative ABC transport system permease protein